LGEGRHGTLFLRKTGWLLLVLVFALVSQHTTASDYGPMSPGTLGYHLSTNAVGHARKHYPTPKDMRLLWRWTFATYSATNDNMKLLTRAKWAENCWLEGVQGLSATPIGMSNSPGGRTLFTMVSPRHFILASHIVGPKWLVAFLDTNNVIHWRAIGEAAAVGVDASVGILNADLPPSVGFLPVLTPDYTNCLPMGNTNYVQGIGMNQDMFVYSQPLLLGASAGVGWNSRAAPPFGLDTNWNITVRDGDSSLPVRMLIGNQLVLVSHHSSVGGGPNLAFLLDGINQKMHYLSTNNHLTTDYQLTPFPLTNWPTIH
jgi:hypothetical protein